MKFVDKINQSKLYLRHTIITGNLCWQKKDKGLVTSLHLNNGRFFVYKAKAAFEYENVRLCVRGLLAKTMGLFANVFFSQSSIFKVTVHPHTLFQQE